MFITLKQGAQVLTIFRLSTCLAAAMSIVLAMWFCTTQSASADAPAIGTVTIVSGGKEVGQYQKLELSFTVSTSATNLQLPYDSTITPYAANLKPDEDARAGVSVDGLFLPPHEKDWTNALVQPGFFYRDYVRTPALPNTNHSTEDLIPTASDAWKVRFAPTLLGLWHYRIRVTDAGGTTLSNPLPIFCAPSSSPGFLRVSPTDTRYFQFDNGTPATMIGENLFFDGFDQFKTAVDKVSAGGASALIRLWIAGRNGQEVIGGFANSSGGRYWQFGGSTQLIGTDAHSGRFCISIPAGSELVTKEVPQKPNTAYVLTAWIKSVGCDSMVVATEDSDTYANHVETIVPTTGSTDWTQISVPIAPHDPQNGTNYFGTLKFQPKGTGAVLVDDVSVTDQTQNVDTLEVGDFERHIHYSQRQSWLLDQVIDYCARNGQYLRLNCLENDDSVFCNIGSDGSAASHDQNNFWGQSVDSTFDLPVRRFQRYYARYIVARWGYSTAVAQWEYNNEGALFNGNHYAGAQSFAHAIHAFSAEGRRPTSTSFYQNASGTSYPADFYDSGCYPDIDYADVHYYPSPGVPGSSYMPLDTPYGGFVRLPDGGPLGMGRLHLDGDATKGQAQDTQFSVARIQGRGTWTVSYQVRADNGTQLDWFGRGPDLELWCDDLQINAYSIPEPPASLPLTGAGYDWHLCSRTFTVPDNDPHSIGFWAYAVGLSGGSVDFSDVKVIAPDGRLWTHYTFNEPLMDHDTASLVQYLGFQYHSLSGDPDINKPLSIGETDIVSPDGSYNPLISQDTAGVYFRQFCWAHMNASGAPVFFFTHANGVATDNGWWKYAGAFQRFMAGIPLTNGHYRNIDAISSDPQIVVIGQKDSVAGDCHFFVYNSSGNWYDLTNDPSAVTPVSGTVMIAYLPNGLYRVEQWDTSMGQCVETTVVKSADGTLAVPVTALASDMAFKISPVVPLNGIKPRKGVSPGLGPANEARPSTYHANLPNKPRRYAE